HSDRQSSKGRLALMRATREDKTMSRQCVVCKRFYAENNLDEHLQNNHLGPHEFWFDMRKYKTSAPSMTIGELVKMVDASTINQVFEDMLGASPDVPLSHNMAVDLTREPHFYCVPPATM